MLFPLILKLIITGLFFISFFKRLVSTEEAVDIDKQFWKTFQKFSGEVSEGVCLCLQRGQNIIKRIIMGNMARMTFTPITVQFYVSGLCFYSYFRQ